MENITAIPSDFPFKTFGTFVGAKGGFAFIDENTGDLSVFEIKEKARTPRTRYKSTLFVRFGRSAFHLMRERMNESLAQIEKRALAREAEKLASEAFDATTAFPVGSVVVHTWGWEQTNKCFYEVMEAGRRHVVLRKLKSKILSYNSTCYAGKCEPIRGEYDTKNTGESGRHSAGIRGIRMESGIGMCSSGLAEMWDGKPCNFTDGN